MVEFQDGFLLKFVCEIIFENVSIFWSYSKRNSSRVTGDISEGRSLQSSLGDAYERIAG